MQIDFVKTPYTTGPNMIRNSGPVFISPPDQKIIQSKKLELERYSTDLWAQSENVEKVISMAAEYCNVYTDNIVDLALRLEEDIAVMYQGRLAAICFCFPSGFKPAERVGMLLGDIHKPVADGEMLVRASPGITRVMCEQPSFRRYVWTVTANPDLSNHPNNHKNTMPVGIDDLYFRYETQTTARVDDDTSLFFVKVDVVPLGNVWNQKILDSINSMSDSVLTYKNLHHIKHLLNTLGE
jgi:hypothetical protein